MIPFNLWSESLVFAVIFTFIVLVPCILVTFMGKKMIHQLGQYPSKTPAIQMSIFVQLVVIEIVTFTLLTGFLFVLAH